MQTMSSDWGSNITASSRNVIARVKVYNGETLMYTLLPSDYIQSIVLTSEVEKKFFGQIVTKKVVIKLVNTTALSIYSGYKLQIEIGCEDEYAQYPWFYISEVETNKTTHETTITAYDILNQASNYVFSDLSVTYPISFTNFTAAVASAVGIDTVSWYASPYDFTITTAPNYDDSSTLRDVLSDCAEIGTSVGFMDYQNRLRFVKLSATGSTEWIGPSNYFEVTTGDSIDLTKITSVTELGDNVSSGTDEGYNQIIRNNGLIELRDDISTILDNMIDSWEPNIYCYDMKWRGNPALEIGDTVYIGIDSMIGFIAYYMGETLTYNGGLVSTVSCGIEEQESEDSNPTTLGEAISKTYAKVDKQSKQITLLASEVTDIEEEVEKTVKQVDVEYYLSTSSTTPTGGSWSTTAPTWESGKYMWSRQKVTYVDGTTAVRNATCIQGAKGEDGEDGEDGRGITSVTAQYYLSDSSTETTGGSWSDIQPTSIPSSKYVWTRSKITYDDATVSYTTEVCDVVWEELKTQKEEIASIVVNTNSIESRVSATETTANNASSELLALRNEVAAQNSTNEESFNTLTSLVNQKITSDAVDIKISQALSNGVTSVETSTGFTFNKDGLTINKSGSDLSTTIDEDGMTIKRNSETMLTADNTGVDARNLHATTYLIIGGNSRFEDWNGGTACFWIGEA